MENREIRDGLREISLVLEKINTSLKTLIEILNKQSDSKNSNDDRAK